MDRVVKAVTVAWLAAAAVVPAVAAAEQVVVAAAQAAVAVAQVVAAAAPAALAAAVLAATAALTENRTMRTPRGVGISLRRQHYEDALASANGPDFLEVQPENFMAYGGLTRRTFHALAERYCIVPHGVALSLGGPAPLSADYLRSLRELFPVPPAWLSEHVAYAADEQEAFHDLLPLPFSYAAMDHVAGRARQVRQTLELPILLENISYYATMPGSQLSEGAFLRGVLEAADAGLLLDVNNVYVNAINQGVDPSAALFALPLERTAQIHLAGHRRHGNLLLDDHGSAVPDAVWSLFEQALQHVGKAVPVVIEWENRVPSFERLMQEVSRAKEIIARA